ncbi:unnamed protein product [Vicia faba]|uniref:Uncharacterized protein n=1 Tax=Vicia faba TaxID=3906 RepID=A0AAV1B7K4_VICFA|nr:unnamed protein product [Vicia faba]
MIAFLLSLSCGNNKINCSSHGCNQLYVVICSIVSLDAKICGCFGTKFTPNSNNTQQLKLFFSVISCDWIRYAKTNLTVLSTASNDTPQTVDPQDHFTESNPNSTVETYSASLQTFGSRGGNGGRGPHSRGGAIHCQVCRNFGHEASIYYHCFKRDSVLTNSQEESKAYGTPSYTISSHRSHSNSYSTCSLSILTMALLSMEYLWPSVSCAISFHVTSSYASIDNASQHSAQNYAPHPSYINPAQNFVQQFAFPPSNSYQVQSMPSPQVYTNHMASTQAP